MKQIKEQTNNEEKINNNYYRCGLISSYTFENFVVGNSNKFAYAISYDIAKEREFYTPVFIYGSTGVGKTHLLYAIGNKVCIDNPNLKVLYISMDEFSKELTNAIKKEKIDDFKNKYKKIAVLLIDDIQFLSGKERLQEELGCIFDYLCHNQVQIVVASSCKPEDIPIFTEIIKEKFDCAIFHEILAPEYNTRVSILNNIIKAKNIKMDNQIIELIAKNSNLNIREMLGLVITINAHKRLLKTS